MNPKDLPEPRYVVAALCLVGGYAVTRMVTHELFVEGLEDSERKGMFIGALVLGAGWAAINVFGLPARWIFLQDAVSEHDKVRSDIEGALR